MKFEYLVFEFDNSVSRENLEGELDMCGNESWELDNVIIGDKFSKFIFKRELKLEEWMISKLIWMNWQVM